MKKHVIAIGILYVLWFIILVSNYSPNTWLTGWDNLHPEFNLPLALSRTLTSVWQEYQGLGLVGGMGHAAALPKELITIVFSWIFPIQTVRFAWTFLMLLLGPIGVYGFLITLFRQKNKTDTIPSVAASFLGALSYLCNLNTAQVFIAPYEPFVAHFAALPWLLWWILAYHQTGKKSSLFIFGFVSFFFSIQNYVPTLFLVYVATCTSLFAGLVFFKKSAIRLKRILTIIGIILCMNAYWLFPFSYFAITNSQIVAAGKINQMATDEIFARNREFGTIQDTLLLKNFWFDTREYYPQLDTTAFMIEPFARHISQPGIYALGILLSLAVILGMIQLAKTPYGRIVLIPFFLGFTMIANATPPFSWIVDWLRENIPLLSQFFRFPFTKWGTELALCYSVCYASCFLLLLPFLEKIGRIARYVTLVILIILPVIFSFPLFTGNLIFSQLKLAIPKEYDQVFQFFKTQPMGRIANLPQNSFWDWKYYQWGAVGSGFIWYGTEQPILDRAFDVWNPYNEQYYWELSYALYKKDALLLDRVFQKYFVQYILFDENIVSPSNNRGLFTEESKELLSQIPSIKKVTEFGEISIYKIQRDKDIKGLRIENDLPMVLPSYQWTDNDVAYRELGDYMLQPQGPALNSQLTKSDIVYPFRSLFTKRSVNEREFGVKETNNTVTISSSTVPDAMPFVIDKNQALVFESVKEGVVDPKNTAPCYPFKNGVVKTTMEDNYLHLQATDNRLCLNFGMPDLWHREGYIVAVTSRHIEGRPLIFALINKTAKHTEIETQLSAVSNQSSEQWNTSYFILPPLSSDGKGYDVYIANDTIGREPSVNDIASVRVYMIPYEEMVHMSSRGNASDRSDLYNDTGVIEIASPSARNDIVSVEHPNPAYYKIQIAENGSQIAENTTLILSQSYDRWWHAYEVGNFQFSIFNFQLGTLLSETFPFLFGKELENHILVNNWSNGWILPSTTEDQQTTTIIIFFLPQLLEWFGFALLPIPFLLLLISKK